MIATSGPDRPVALVTGGGGDIGRAIAQRLARTSAAVAVIDIDEGAATETANLVRSVGCKAMAIRADVSSPSETAAFVAAVEDELGPIGIFANNAGIEGVVAPLHEYPDDTFDRLMQGQCEGRLPWAETRAGEDEVAWLWSDRQYGLDLRDPRPCRSCRICRVQARGAGPDPDSGIGGDGNAKSESMPSFPVRSNPG